MRFQGLLFIVEVKWNLTVIFLKVTKIIHHGWSMLIFLIPFFNFTQPGRQSCKHFLCHWGRLWKPIQFCASIPIFRAPLYLKLSHKTEETLCLLSHFVVCVRAPGRENASSSEKNWSMFPVVENIFLSTTMYQNMCLYSSVKKKNVTVIYPGSRFLKKNCPFLVLLICMNVPFVAIMSIKLQITAQRNYSWLPTRISSRYRLQRALWLGINAAEKQSVRSR